MRANFFISSILICFIFCAACSRSEKKSAPEAKETGGGDEYVTAFFNVGHELESDLRAGLCADSGIDPDKLHAVMVRTFPLSYSQPEVWDLNGRRRQAVNWHALHIDSIGVGQIEAEKLKSNRTGQRVLFVHEAAPFLGLKDAGGEISGQFYNCSVSDKKQFAPGTPIYHKKNRMRGNTNDTVHTWARYNLNLPLKGNLNCHDFYNETKTEIFWPKLQGTDSATLLAHFAKNISPTLYKGPYIFQAESSENVRAQCSDIERFENAKYSALYLHSMDDVSMIFPIMAAEGAAAQYVENHEFCLTLRWSYDPLPTEIPEPSFDTFRPGRETVSVTSNYVEWESCSFYSFPRGPWDFSGSEVSDLYSRFARYEKQAEISRTDFAKKFQVGDEATINTDAEGPVKLRIVDLLASGEARITWPYYDSDSRRPLMPLSQLGFPVESLGDFSTGEEVTSATETWTHGSGHIRRIWSNGTADVEWSSGAAEVLTRLSSLKRSN